MVLLHHYLAPSSSGKLDLLVFIVHCKLNVNWHCCTGVIAIYNSGETEVVMDSFNIKIRQKILECEIYVRGKVGKICLDVLLSTRTS